METWQLIVGIGVLLFLTAILNSIAESIERRQREKRIRILRLKRRIDEIVEQLERMKPLDIPESIIECLQDEIMARLTEIQKLEPKFHPSEEIIAYVRQHQDDEPATSEAPKTEEEKVNFEQITEEALQQYILQIKGFSQYLQTLVLIAPENIKKKLNFHDILTGYRFQKIYQFYAYQAQQYLQQEQFDKAAAEVEKILGPLDKLNYNNDELSAIRQQSEQLLQDIRSLKMQHIEKLAEEKNETEETADNDAGETTEQAAES